MNRGNIETRESFIARSVRWWTLHGQFENKENHKYFLHFCKQYNIFNYINKEVIVAEVGPGPYGGILEDLHVECKEKVFIDYAMKELMELKFISWPIEDARYLTCPAEYIDLPDNYADTLISYNCLDHGWDIFKAIQECVRVAKTCFINFDCRADLESECISHSPEFYISHHQLLCSNEIEKFLNSLRSDKIEIEFHVKRVQHPFPCAEFVINKKEII